MNISVIIPCYNRQSLIARAIDSVLAQTYAALEVIVVDDGSSDNSADFIRRQYPNVKLLQQSQHGVSHARNQGIRLAQGNWIAFLDSDDAWHTDKLQQQVSALQQQPQYQICHTHEIWIRKDKRVNQMRKHEKFGGHIYQHCLQQCLMAPSSILINRDVFDKIGLFDETLPVCEDYDLWLRITARYAVLYLEQALITKYGGHDDQLSHQFWGMDRFRIKALHKMLQSSVLNSVDRQATVDVLRDKIRIYLIGAEKRQKHDEIAYYRQLLQQYDVAPTA